MKFQLNLLRVTQLLIAIENDGFMLFFYSYASALAFWMLNLDSFAHERPVYAIDLLGFGKSSRPNFSTDPDEIENQYVTSLEEWRKVMKIEKMILLGRQWMTLLCDF